MSQRRILVVDDHPMNLKLLTFLLTSRGFAAVVARNADEARAALEREPPELVLMDIQLPHTDGLTLTRELRGEERWRKVPIVAVTAYAMASDEQAAREAGCAGFVSKPIDTRALLALIDRLLEERS